MKAPLYFRCILLMLVFGLFNCVHAQQLAFPTAEGGGKYTLGGRGGDVIEVTNLEDSGEGSLRAAVEASGPRTVVFRVSGTIELESDLDIRNPYITIAGQTAPGEGICLKNYPIMIRTDQVIIRYLRVRLGDESSTESDAISSRYQKNIIVDHVSASWSVDETISIYHCDSITVQWCLISESLYNSTHPKGHHGFGGIWGGTNSSYHHNLIAHHSSRNPRFASGCGNTDFRNNVVYNWGYQSIYGGEKVQPDSDFDFTEVNMVANYLRSGPATLSGVVYRIAQPSSRNSLEDYGQWYVEENVVHGYPNVSADNWAQGVQPDANTQTVKDAIRMAEPALHVPIGEQTAQEAYASVLKGAGAIYPRRDTVDRRIAAEAGQGTATFGNGSYNTDQGMGNKITGIIDSQTDVGGWPLLISAPAPEDRDHDGMPDAWELDHGLDADDPEDRNLPGEGGYTMLELYLNSITEYPEFLLPPSGLEAILLDYTRVELRWEDNTDDETGFRIERAEGATGSFDSIAVVEANVSVYTDSLLKELTHYRYRVIAFNDSLESSPGEEEGVTTLSPTSPPLPVDSPSPSDQAAYISTHPVLGWEASINADNYDIYFGTANPPPFFVNQAESTFEPGELGRGKTYYWQVDGKNANGTTPGVVWSFTVKPLVVPGRVAYWKFDETFQTYAINDEDRQLDGALKNMQATSWTDGILDGGLEFLGSDEYVVVRDPEVLNFRDESFSVSLWLKAATLPAGSMYLVNKGSFAADAATGDNGKWYGLEIKDGELRFAVDDNANKSQVALSGAGSILEGKWVHIVGCRDVENTMLKLYVNGELRSSTADVSGNISQENDLYIGNSTTGTAPLSGILDDLKIFNYALSDAEVHAMYDSMAVNSVQAGPAGPETMSVTVYPNPFAGTTTFRYELGTGCNVSLCLFDAVGRKAASLINEYRSAGVHSFVFEPGDFKGGVYFYQLDAGGIQSHGKILLLK